MIEKQLQCIRCGKQYNMSLFFEGCPKCFSEGKVSPLEVIYDYESIKRVTNGKIWDPNYPSMWKFKSLLPVNNEESIISLGEGDTPLIRNNNLCQKVGLENLYFKNEGCNPNWAFKDRFQSVSISMALEKKFKKVITCSTGNHGLSAAAYSCAGGLKCMVLCRKDMSLLLRKMLLFYGSTAIDAEKIDVKRIIKKATKNYNWYPSTAAFPFSMSNPFGMEGYKTIAYEIYSKTKQVPNWIFMPVGGGDGLYGVWKGFIELEKMGLTDRLPKMVGCQTELINPLVQSFDKKLHDSVEVKEVRSIAVSIADSVCGFHALKSLYDSGGLAISVPDEEIINAVRILASYGIAPETASAATFACLLQLAKKGSLQKDDIIVCVLTSTILKWPEMITKMVDIANIAKDTKRINEILEKT